MKISIPVIVPTQEPLDTPGRTQSVIPQPIIQFREFAVDAFRYAKWREFLNTPKKNEN
jgi:hypothetical protein